MAMLCCEKRQLFTPVCEGKQPKRCARDLSLPADLAPLRCKLGNSCRMESILHEPKVQSRRGDVSEGVRLLGRVPALEPQA